MWRKSFFIYVRLKNILPTTFCASKHHRNGVNVTPGGELELSNATSDFARTPFRFQNYFSCNKHPLLRSSLAGALTQSLQLTRRSRPPAKRPLIYIITFFFPSRTRRSHSPARWCPRRRSPERPLGSSRPSSPPTAIPSRTLWRRSPSSSSTSWVAS